MDEYRPWAEAWDAARVEFGRWRREAASIIVTPLVAVAGTAVAGLYHDLEALAIAAGAGLFVGFVLLPSWTLLRVRVGANNRFLRAAVGDLSRQVEDLRSTGSDSAAVQGVLPVAPIKADPQAPSLKVVDNPRNRRFWKPRTLPGLGPEPLHATTAMWATNTRESGPVRLLAARLDNPDLEDQRSVAPIHGRVVRADSDDAIQAGPLVIAAGTTVEIECIFTLPKIATPSKIQPHDPSSVVGVVVVVDQFNNEYRTPRVAWRR